MRFGDFSFFCWHLQKQIARLNFLKNFETFPSDLERTDKDKSI